MTSQRFMPVVAIKAHRGNISVYYTGLGAVTPINTVTVKSRVDGQLMVIHYKEGPNGSLIVCVKSLVATANEDRGA